MMFFLVLDVVTYSGNLRLADRKSSIMILPGEWPGRALLTPTRRTRLQFTHEIGNGNGRRNLSQQMDVISYATHLECDSFHPAYGPAQIGMEVVAP